MFLISKDGYSIIEVKQVDMNFKYEKQTMVERSPIGEKPTCIIIVNDKFNYGEYGEVQGKIAFDEIINALKNGKTYFDMRDIKFSGEKE